MPGNPPHANRVLERENARLRRWLEIIAQSDEDDDPAGDAADALDGKEPPE